MPRRRHFGASAEEGKAGRERGESAGGEDGGAGTRGSRPARGGSRKQQAPPTAGTTPGAAPPPAAGAAAGHVRPALGLRRRPPQLAHAPGPPRGWGLRAGGAPSAAATLPTPWGRGSRRRRRPPSRPARRPAPSPCPPGAQARPSPGRASSASRPRGQAPTSRDRGAPGAPGRGRLSESPGGASQGSRGRCRCRGVPSACASCQAVAGFVTSLSLCCTFFCSAPLWLSVCVASFTERASLALYSFISLSCLKLTSGEDRILSALAVNLTAFP